jgi:hypothetical protein
MSITETRPPTAPYSPPAAPKRNVKRILSYVGVGVLGLAIGAAGSGGEAETPDPEVVEKIVTVDPTADQIAALDTRAADIDARAAQLASDTTALDARDVAVSAKEAAKKASTFGDGVYEVGVDIQPGTYATDGGRCYWEKSTGGDGIGSILGNDNVSGPVVLMIEPTVKFFKASGCGTWTKR